MKLNILRHGRLECITCEWLGARLHPFFDRCRGDVFDAVLLRQLEAVDKHGQHLLLIGWIRGIASGYHEDDIRLEPEGLDTIDEVIGIFGINAREMRNLSTSYFHR